MTFYQKTDNVVKTVSFRISSDHGWQLGEHGLWDKQVFGVAIHIPRNNGSDLAYLDEPRVSSYAHPLPFSAHALRPADRV